MRVLSEEGIDVGLRTIGSELAPEARDAPTGLLTASTNSNRSVGPVNSLLKLQYILF